MKYTLSLLASKNQYLEYRLSEDSDNAFDDAKRATGAKPIHVRLETSGINDKKKANDYLDLMTKQYPDLIMSNPRIENKRTLTFDILSMLDDQDIEHKVDEFFTMFKGPFEITNKFVLRPREESERLKGSINIQEAVSAAIRAGIHEDEVNQSNRFPYRQNFSATDELRKLATLRDDKVITEDEFQQMKQAIIKKVLQQSA
jgi:hypothetical protein